MKIEIINQISEFSEKLTHKMMQTSSLFIENADKIISKHK